MAVPLALLLDLVRLGATAVLLGLAIAVDLAPVAPGAQGWPVPDLLLCAVACIAGRRPRMLPAWMVLAAGLARDLLAGAPVGPGTAALLIASAYLRDRAASPRGPGFVAEWLRFAAVAGGTLMLPAALLWVTFAGVPDPAALGLRWAVTAAAYPLVVGLLRIGRSRQPGGGAMETRPA